jgi:hypothetical protein
VPAVPRHRANVIAAVPEDHPPFVIVGVIGIEIEGLRVAFVAGDPECLAVRAEALERGLHLAAGRQVLHRSVALADIDVVELVAALVRGEDHPCVVREVARPEGGVVPGLGQRLRGPAAYRQRVGVEYARLIRTDQDRLAVRRPDMAERRAQAVAGRLVKLLGGVAAARLRCRLCLRPRAGRLCRRRAERYHAQADQKHRSSSAAHGIPPVFCESGG